MANNFKLVTYQIKYLVANYQSQTVEEYLVKSKYNEDQKMYDIVEFKVNEVYYIEEIQQFI